MIKIRFATILRAVLLLSIFTAASTGSAVTPEPSPFAPSCFKHLDKVVFVATAPSGLLPAAINGVTQDIIIEGVPGQPTNITRAIRERVTTLIPSHLVSLVSIQIKDISYQIDPTCAGSFLVFPIFDVRGTNNTVLKITNNHKTSPVRVRLNVVCPGTLGLESDPFCDSLGTHTTINASTTATIDVRNFFHPPCEEGFIVAFAENDNHEAIAFDYLLGHLSVNGATSLRVVSIPSVKPEGTVLGTGKALQFGPNGPSQDYAGPGTQLSSPFLSVSDDGTVNSELVLMTLDTIAGADNPASRVDINFFSETMVPFSTNWRYVCWSRVKLDIIDYNFRTMLLGSATGTMDIFPDPTCPIPGACPPLNIFDPVIFGAMIKNDISTSTTRVLAPLGRAKSTVYVPR